MTRWLCRILADLSLVSAALILFFWIYSHYSTAWVVLTVPPRYSTSIQFHTGSTSCFWDSGSQRTSLSLRVAGSGLEEGGHLLRYLQVQWHGFFILTYERNGWLIAPTWAPLVLALVLPAIRIAVRRFKRRSRRADHCRVCGYDLRATPDRCPECGTVASETPRDDALVPEA